MKTATLFFPHTTFTLQQVVKLTGFQYSTVWRHVRNVQSISAESAVRYEKALGVPRSKLRPDLWPPQNGDTKSSHAS